MSDFSTRFHNLRVENGYTLDALADTLNKKYETNFTKSTFSKWENGRSEPSFYNIPYIADFFNVTVDYLIGVTEAGKYISEKIDSQNEYNAFKNRIQKEFPDAGNKFILDEKTFDAVKKYIQLDDLGRSVVDHVIDLELNCSQQRKTRHLAYYGKIAAAGTFIDSYELLMHGTIDVKDDALSSRADYAIGVSGDSMEPKYCDGDIVLVRKTRIIDYGDVGIFQYNGDIYIKELSRDGLKSLNDRYPVIRNNDDIRCLGHVIGKAEMIK